MAVEFTQEIVAGAIETEKTTGVPASITLGQLVLESGYRNPSSLSTLAKDYNNYFGVKAFSSWQGYRTPYMTNSSGQDGAVYRAYTTVTEGLQDHAKVLENERYQKYFRQATSIEDYAKGLQLGGYATDPNYATKLISVIKSNNLTQYDNMQLSNVSSLNLPSVNNGLDVTNLASVNNGLEVTNLASGTNLFSGNILSKSLKTVIFVLFFLLVLIVAIVSFMKAFDIQATDLIPQTKALKKVSKKGA